MPSTPPDPPDPTHPQRPDWFPRDVPQFNPATAHFPTRFILSAMVGVAALVLLAQSFIVVQAGERAVIFSQVSGVQHFQLSEGLHFNIPLLWVPTKYDVKTLTYTMSGSTSESSQSEHRPSEDTASGEQVPDDSVVALTADGLPVTIDISVRFHIEPDKVWKLHQEIGPKFVDKVVRPQARSITRSAFSQFPVIDVYTGKRQAIVDQIQHELKDKMAANYLILDEVLLRDIRFPPEFQSAIEQKQVAQQEAQQMKYEVERAQSMKQQQIIEAQGEATAIRKKADALAQNPQLIQYEYVQRLPANTRTIITDSKTIINLGDALGDSSGEEKRTP